METAVQVEDHMVSDTEREQATESAVKRTEPVNEKKDIKEPGCESAAVEGSLQLSENVTLDSDVMDETEFTKLRGQISGAYYIPPSTRSGLASSELYGPGSGQHMSLSVSALAKAG